MMPHSSILCCAIFTYEDGVSLEAGDGVIIAHVAKNYSGWLYEMRQRAARAVGEQPGTTIRLHQPRIVGDQAWEAMCRHWEDEVFKKKSEQAKKNRSQLRVVHTTSSQSFEEVKSAMTSSLGRPLTMTEFWDRAHTPKESIILSPAALAIRDQFQSLRDSRLAELRAARGDPEALDSTTPLPEIELYWDEELRLWVASQDPPTSSTGRYRVLGLSRIPVYTLPGGSSQRHRPRAHVGSFDSGAGLDDALFQRVIAAVSERFRTYLAFRHQHLPTHMRLHQLARDIAAGATVESTGLSPEQFIALSGEVLRMVVTLLAEAFGEQSESRQGGDGDRRVVVTDSHPPERPESQGGGGDEHQRRPPSSDDPPLS